MAMYGILYTYMVTPVKKKNKKYRWLRKRQLKLNHQWRYDFDYISKLSEEEKEWLNKFIKEYYDANVKKGDKDALHFEDAHRKDCYNRNNRGNRDMMSILNSRGAMDRIDDDESRAEPVEETEDD